MLKALPTLIAAGFLDQPLFAQTTNNLAPGAPGRDAQWEGAGKEGVGTSAALESKVWFTLRGGAMTEVYYPTVDAANTVSSQLVVAGGEASGQAREPRAGIASGRGHRLGRAARVVYGTVHTPGRQTSGGAQPGHARHRRGPLLEAAVNAFRQLAGVRSTGEASRAI